MTLLAFVWVGLTTAMGALLDATLVGLVVGLAVVFVAMLLVIWARIS